MISYTSITHVSENVFAVIAGNETISEEGTRIKKFEEELSMLTSAQEKLQSASAHAQGHWLFRNPFKRASNSLQDRLDWLVANIAASHAKVAKSERNVTYAKAAMARS